MMSTAGMTTAYSTSRVDATLRLSTLTKILSQISTMRSERNALLENVTVDANGKIDFADKSVTENTRVSYQSTISRTLFAYIFCTSS